MDLDRLHAQLAHEEGRPANTYPDSKKILTGGIGHNLEAEPEPGYDRVGIPVSDEMCAKWFRKDIDDAISDLDHHCPWWKQLDDVRQNALANLVFNMGWGNGNEGLSTFKNTLAAFAVKDYTRAAMGFKNSQYARDVGPLRSNRICRMVESGKWPADIPGTPDYTGGK